MALVRRGTKIYWYESYRAGGRVTSRYVASGAVAEACAWIVDFDRRKEARWRARHRRRLAALDARLRGPRGPGPAGGGGGPGGGGGGAGPRGAGGAGGGRGRRGGG